MTPVNNEREREQAICPALLRFVVLLGGAVAAIVLGLAGPSWAADAPVVTPLQGSVGTTPSAGWSFTYDTAAGDATCTLSKGAVLETRTPCASPATFALSAGDGTYAFAVTVGDSPAGTSSYTLDTAPAAPTVTGPTGPSPERRPVFTLDAEDGVTWSCVIEGPSSTFSTGCSEGTWIFDLTGAPDGRYTGTITVSRNGSTSPATIRSYTLDTKAPVAPGVTGPSGPSSDTTPTFTLSGETGASYSCTLTSPSSAVTTPACAAGSFTPQLSGDGTWTLSVTQTDLAGHRSPATTRTYVLDTAAPAVGVSGPSGPSADRTPAFTITSDGSPLTCVLVSPAGSEQVLTCAPGELRLSLPAGGDELWTIRVTATAASGATAVASTTYRLDTAAPAAGLSGPAGPSTVLDPVFTVSGEAGAGYACSLTSPTGAVQVLTCEAGPLQLALPTGADGTWTLRVIVTDAAGNSATATSTYRLDTTAPAVGVTGPEGPSNDRTPSYVLSAESGADLTCSLAAPDGTSSPLTCAAGAVELSLPAGQDGTWTLRVTATDAAGNRATATATYELDTAAPEVAVNGPTGPSPDRQPVFQLSGENGGEYSCTLTGPDGVTEPVLCGAGELRLSLPADGDGLWTLRVTLVGAAGTTGTASAVYRLDTTPPDLVIGGSDGSWSLEVDGGLVVACVLISPDGAERPVDCSSGTVTIALSDLAPGEWVLRVSAADEAGNTRVVERAFLVAARTDRPAQLPPAESAAQQPLPAVRPPAEAPVVEPPVEEPLVEEPPVEEPPVEEPPVVAPPAEQPPVAGPPVAQPPTTGPGVPEPPVVQPAADVPPVAVVAPAGAVAPGPGDEPAPVEEPGQTDAAEPGLVERLPAALAQALPEPLRTLAGAVAEGAAPRVVQRLAAAADLQTRWRATLRLLGDAAAVGGVPLLLLLLVGAFLSLQNRIDRNDPKLALAPVHAHQALPFRPMERVAT